MPDRVKEKLVELFLNWGGLSNCAEDMADYFIANDVTFAKDNDVPSNWISVKDRLPENGKKVLVYCKENKNDYEIGAYSDTYRGFFVRQTCYENITHWMPLPQPPKGE